MSIDEITTQLRALSDAEFERVFDEIFFIRQEREARPAVERAQVQFVAEMERAGVLQAPAASTVSEDGTVTNREAWVDPEGAPHRSYRLGNVVEHRGPLWRSVHPGLNKSEPGTDRKWELYAEPDAAPDAPDETDEVVVPGNGKPGKRVPPGQGKKNQ